MLDFLRQRYTYKPAPAHLWFGVDGSKLSRVKDLQEAPAGIRFLSIEPLIGPVGTWTCPASIG
jgi:protein gp37